MKCEKWNCCKDVCNLVLKTIFVAVFTYGVMSAVCCMKSCNVGCKSQSTCGKVVQAKQCGIDCVKPCCNPIKGAK